MLTLILLIRQKETKISFSQLVKLVSGVLPLIFLRLTRSAERKKSEEEEEEEEAVIKRSFLIN